MTERTDDIPEGFPESDTGHSTGSMSGGSDSGIRQALSTRGMTLGDFFTIKRGVESGDNDFFVVTPAIAISRDLPFEFLRPILPSPQRLRDDEIIADPEGHPILDGKLFLLDCPLPEREIQEQYPALWSYLGHGVAQGVHERYSCRHRTPWYSQERRPPAPYLCAYMGQKWEEDGPPFRFILNHSKAVAPNVYLMMYPRPALAERLQNNYPLEIQLWTALNEIGTGEIQDRERVYDSGAGRLEPKELASVSAGRILRLIPDLIPDSAAQMNLFDVTS